MRTGAPGRFECEVYLKAWQLDLRGPDVMHHIDNCLWCGTLINGHPGEFPLPIVEEARIRMAERAEQQAALRQRRRRRFLAGAASFLGLAGLGVGTWVATRPSGPSPTPNLDAIEATSANNLERLYVLGGATAVRSRIASLGPTDLNLVFQWLVSKGHAVFYPDLIAMLGDPRTPVRRLASFWLTRVDPIALQPLLPSLEAAANAETDDKRQAALRRLVAIVRAS